MNGNVFVVDTNVLVAGLLTTDRDSPTAKVLDAILTGNLYYLLSPDLLLEYRDVLLRPRIAQRHGLGKTEIDQLLTEITANAIWREMPQPPMHLPPDMGDAHLWALMASEPTAILITGDRLLIQKPMPKRSVISPATWAANFYKEPSGK